MALAKGCLSPNDLTLVQNACSISSRCRSSVGLPVSTRRLCIAVKTVAPVMIL